MKPATLTLLATLAWRNLWRHTRRTLVILFALALVLGNAAAWATTAALAGGIDLSAVAEGMELVGVAPVIYPAWSAADRAAANVLVFGLGLLASLYPAWRASRYMPIEALTRV